MSYRDEDEDEEETFEIMSSIAHKAHHLAELLADNTDFVKKISRAIQGQDTYPISVGMEEWFDVDASYNALLVGHLNDLGWDVECECGYDARDEFSLLLVPK